VNKAPAAGVGVSGTRIVAIVGPTASGKSAVALELALLLGGEIISVDSMQVYRGMDIGTAKPSTADQARVRHHLIDVADLNQGFDAAAFRHAAIPVISALIERGKTPVLCGGTGFYFRALLDGLGTAPPSLPALREELEGTPLERLLEELRRSDPDAYATIDRANRRRVVRAVEVVRLTDRPFSQQRGRGPLPGAAHPHEGDQRWETFGLQRAPTDLKGRMDARVARMFEEGLVEETRRLRVTGLEHNRTALQAIGYRQVIEYLRGERSLADTRELIRLKTRQLARRQMTWFRRQMPVTWVHVGAGESGLETAGRIVQLLGTRESGGFI
jgi:tRNA dimethylallyltransferase